MSTLNLSIHPPPEDIWNFCFNSSTANSSQSNAAVAEAALFWVEGIGLSMISLIGILGNSMTVVVLNRISLNNVFNQVSSF